MTSLLSNQVFYSTNNIQILLSTAVVQVLDYQGKIHEIRALLDSGSQSNFVTEPFCPHYHFNKNALNIPPNIQLADPNFDQSGEIELLIGAETFYDLLCIGQVKLGKPNRLCSGHDSGWVVSGPLNSLEINKQTSKAICGFVSTTKIDANLTKFWEIENVDNAQVFSNKKNRAKFISKKKHST
ncbi:hypothetical protein NQ317_018488 [Molorchus minor]|uniref:Peptidase A2 domain-containing protein n=1 Tax=Molorchus minor TaxID=1323400 RepID=A0ABQ9JYF2_9CUCU|nr:hypothetical protein NQ317_018488 [Molorchus minor]